MDLCGESESSSTSSFKLLHVSNETQKLNQMIDSWSKGVNLDDQSKNIAEVLLKSTLKLQETMAMLSRMQEASKFMARLKEAEVKPNEKHKRKVDNVNDKSSGLDAKNYRSMNHLHHTKFSVDESASTDSFRDLNKVHRDGLSAKALSSTKECSFQEGGYQAERTGFGRFQNANYKNCNEETKKVIKDSLAKQNLPSISFYEKKKHFGKRQYGVLPEVHSSSLWTSLSNSSESNETAGQPMKTTKSPNLIAKLMGLEEFPAEAVRSTLQELETKNNENYYQKKPVFNFQMPKVLNPQIDRASDEGQKDLKEIIEGMQYKGLLRYILSKDYPKSSRVQNETEDLPPIVMIKPLPDSGHNGDVEKGLTDLMPRKIKYSSIKRVLSKPASKENKNAGAGAINLSKPNTPAQCHVERQKVKSVSRKYDNVKKGSEDGKNMVDKHNWKFSQAINTPIKARSTQLKKLDYIPKKCPVNKLTNKQKNDMRQSRKGASEFLVDQTPKMEANIGKLQWRSSSVNPIAKKTIQRENKENSDLTQEHTNHSTTTSTSSDAHDPTIQQDGSKNPAEDCINTDEKCPVKAGAREHTPGLSFTSAENNRNPNKTIGITTDSCEQHLLLSSPLFLGKMEKLFSLKKENPSQLLSPTQAKNNTDDIRTLLDCANELLERKCYEMALFCHPLLQTHLRGNDTTSLDSLMDEVIGGIDTLRSYCKTDTDCCQTDRIFLILGKDLMCKSIVVNGVWDRSWLNVISFGEAEVVVNEVEKNILGGLIEDTVMSLAMPVSPSISVLL